MTILRFCAPDGWSRTAVQWTGGNEIEVLGELGRDSFHTIADGDGTAAYRPQGRGDTWRAVRIGDWLVLEKFGWERMTDEALKLYAQGPIQDS